MPFDHAKCPNPQCAAVLDPERLKAGPKGPVCPRCDTALRMEDIFGVMDSWAEEDQENLSLDDAVPGFGAGGSPGRADDFEERRPLNLDNLLPGPTSSGNKRKR